VWSAEGVLGAAWSFRILRLLLGLVLAAGFVRSGAVVKGGAVPVSPLLFSNVPIVAGA
jgi:hypothetical protein|tara:strand:- start:716 stop:889 length:174 start_codon:yes stop_codon:yes gene_type:complete